MDSIVIRTDTGLGRVKYVWDPSGLGLVAFEQDFKDMIYLPIGVHNWPSGTAACFMFRP